MNTDDRWFMEWYWHTATPAEKELYDKASDYQPLFADMMFERDSSTYDLIMCKSRPQEGEEWIDDVIEPPDELNFLSYTWFHFSVDDLDDKGGFFDEKTQTLCISSDEVENDSVLLHELIHLHEYVINELPLYFHDMVYWALYKDLKGKIPKLDEIITGHAHLLVGSSIYSQGGLHDILFLLKSFDLDIRMKYPLGTVFGYGRCDDFKDYCYIS